MTTATDIARYLVHLAGQDEEGEPFTHMRLQKLLYYCQGWHLAWYGEPLFADELQAWEHGPVVPGVYKEFARYGRQELPPAGPPPALTARAAAAVEHVWRHYRKFSASGLRDLSHAEPPWKSRYAPGDRGAVITPADLMGYFGARYERETGMKPGTEAEIDAQVAAGQTISLEEWKEAYLA